MGHRCAAYWRVSVYGVQVTCNRTHSGIQGTVSCLTQQSTDDENQLPGTISSSSLSIPPIHISHRRPNQTRYTNPDNSKPSTPHSRRPVNPNLTTNKYCAQSIRPHNQLINLPIIRVICRVETDDSGEKIPTSERAGPKRRDG